MRSKMCACAAFALMAGVASAADEYNGYLSINDEDYGYWEGRPTIHFAGSTVPIDELTGVHTLVTFDIGHDLARGLVRSTTDQRQREAQPQQDGAVSIATEADVAVSGASGEPEPPRGEGEWRFLYRYTTIGIGLYQGSDATHHLYCDSGASVFAWLGAGVTDQTSPDDAANRLIIDENGMARLRFACEKPISVTN